MSRSASPLGLVSAGRESLGQQPADHVRACAALHLGDLVDFGDGLGVEADRVHVTGHATEGNTMGNNVGRCDTILSMDDLAEYGDDRLPESFWQRVKVTSNGCWEWVGHVRSSGYGSTTMPGTKMSSSPHRVAYTFLVGPIPSGLHVDHLCRNRPCCNPAHLEAVTPKENNLRSTSPAAHNAVKTHCKHGHPFDEANTLVKNFGGYPHRTCRACSRKEVRERRANQVPVPPNVGDVWKARDLRDRQAPVTVTAVDDTYVYTERVKTGRVRLSIWSQQYRRLHSEETS